MPHIFNISQEVKAIEDTEQTLKCVVTGIPSPNVEWHRGRGETLDSRWSHSFLTKNSLNLNTSMANFDHTGLPIITHTVYIRNIKTSDAGRYICVAKNRAGEVREKVQLIVLGNFFF